MTDITTLVNPLFDFTLGDIKYEVRKASLEKTIQYYNKVKELKDDPAADLKLVAYCIWLILKEADASLTEEKIQQLVPGDVDIIGVISQLGFINPKKMEMAKRLQEAVVDQLTLPSSLPSSPSELDGNPVLSAS